MVQRCTNQNNKRWSSYGGRGICVCDRWLKFDNFYADMGDRPLGRSLDRIDNNLGYFKENCRWATTLEQSRNKRLYSNSSTGFPGVTKRGKHYRAQISVNGKVLMLGNCFKTAEEASIARKNAEAVYWNKPQLQPA